MAIRARLSAPHPRPREEWPYHEAEWTAMSAKILEDGDRRMEAETYLASGYGVRLAIEARLKGWVSFSEVAHVWQPPRTKGILVSPSYGTPFLAATQVFDQSPIPRKWLAIEKINHASAMLVQPGVILVTRSGAVGRSTLAFAPHLETLISDDLLRVEARDERLWGWLYAYLRASKVRAMMTSSRYGHVIKHLEVGHLNNLPIPVLSDALIDKFKHQTHRILDLREKSHAATLQAEAHFEESVGALNICDPGESGFVIRASTLFENRRRMDALPYNLAVRTIYDHLKKKSRGFSRLVDTGFRVWLPNRFRRIPAQDGVALVSSSALFEINPDTEKLIADADFGDPYRGRVRPGWLLVARSGQIYGLNGSVVLATKALANKVVSDHVIRVAPNANAKMRTGYIATALSHPTLGRPLMKSLPYGSSIPEIDPHDFLNLPIVRLPDGEENRIADLTEQAAELRGKADLVENQLADEAEKALDRFISGASGKVPTDS